MKMMQIGRNVGLCVAVAALCAPFAQAQDAKPVDPKVKKAELRKMCDEALADLYKAKPEIKAAVAKSAGYGCFTSFGLSFFVGGAGGQGLVHSNRMKTDTYMNMAQASGGFDFGVKQYREVLVFKDSKTLDRFVDKGWEFGGSATAAAAAGGKGGSVDDTQISASAIQVYPMTTTGLAAGVSAAGRKYWKDTELNAAK
ncbi:MAG: YSC84-related protein [Rubrivivax sp.]|nr:YSC84-related protein [Rubrivivax sp.]